MQVTDDQFAVADDQTDPQTAVPLVKPIRAMYQHGNYSIFLHIANERGFPICGFADYHKAIAYWEPCTGEVNCERCLGLTRKLPTEELIET